MVRYSVLPVLLLGMQLFAQATSSPSDVVRVTRDGGRQVSVDAENRVTVRSALTGAVETKSTNLNLGDGHVADFDLDGTGAAYFLTSNHSVVKWRAQAAGFEFVTRLDSPATAIGVDESGTRIFVAMRDSIWMLDGGGNVVLRGSAEVRNVVKLRFDEGTGTLFAQGTDYLASLPASTLATATVFSGAAAASRSLDGGLPGIYPITFRIEPQLQSVNPGGTAFFTIRGTQIEVGSGAWTVSVESPVPGTLSRSVMTVNDAVSYQIPVPANQPPGVYRIVARLDGGANGNASAVFVVPFPNATNIDIWGTGLVREGRLAQGQTDQHYRIVTSPDPECQTPYIAQRVPQLIGPAWTEDGGLAQWISGRFDAITGCFAGLYRYRTDIDLRTFDPTTANIAVAVYADNAATLEVNGVAIASEPQEIGEPQAFRVPRIYAIPRSALRTGVNELDFIVRNDAMAGLTRNPTGLRVEVLHATAVPNVAPEPPPVGDFWLSVDPPFQFVNGTTAHYTVRVNRIGGFAGTPRFELNMVPPTGYTAVFNGNTLSVTRDLNETTAPTTWRFAILGIFNQTTRTVDVAFIQNRLTPVDLPLYSTGVIQYATPAGAGTNDLHYVMTQSPDPSFPGPAVKVVDEATSPIGPWILNDQYSKWVGPRQDANNSNRAGIYRYQTTFDLGLGSADTAAIALRWAADNDTRAYLNGVPVVGLVPIDNFRRLNEALITDGFRPGINVLEFEVTNTDLGGPSPTGLRVEVIRAQAARNPNRVVQVLRGRTSTGPVPAQATAFNYTGPAGVTVTSNGLNLVVAASDAAPLGVFPVRVTYSPSNVIQDFFVVVGARNSVSYIVNSTGQGDEGTVDPNYRMIESPDPLHLPPNAYIILSNTSPVSLGYWVPNNINSRWIAPRRDALNPVGAGTYRYRTTFDMSGRNLADAMLALEWAADNRGRVELNGVVQDRIDYANGFAAMRQVSITSGFRDGVNNLDFVVINDGAPNEANPSGLHVQILGAFAVSQGTNPGPDFVITPDPGVRQINYGQSTTFDIRATPNFTFDNVPVVYSIVNPPAGFTFTFNPPAAVVSTTLTVTASNNIARGQYPITIRGRWGDIIRETTVRVDILQSAPQLAVFSTGRTTIGGVDPNYQLIDGLGLARPAYRPDLVDSTVFWGVGTWITPSPVFEERAAIGTYRYRTTFNTTGFNLNSIVIEGIWDADDGALAYLNGTLVGVLEKPSIFQPGTLRIASGFVAGVNQLDFVVNNNTSSPTGLMVQINSVTATQQ